MHDFNVTKLFGIPMKARKISPPRMSLGYFLVLVALKLTVMAHRRRGLEYWHRIFFRS